MRYDSNTWYIILREDSFFFNCSSKMITLSVNRLICRRYFNPERSIYIYVYKCEWIMYVQYLGTRELF